MKKILISFTLFVAFSFSLSAQMVLQAKFTGLGQYDNIRREKLNKSGEKFSIYFDYQKTVYYNTDGSIWKILDSSVIKQVPCTKARWSGLAWTNTYKSTNDLEFSYYCNGNKSFGFADENGKSFFSSNEQVIDYKFYGKKGIVTTDKFIFSSQDSFKTFKYYADKNGALTLAKTFKDSRTALMGFSNVAQYSAKNFYQITKDNKVNLFDLNFNPLATTPVPAFPSEVPIVIVEDISQKLYNADDKWEFALSYYDAKFDVKYRIFDETGKILKEFNNFPNTNSTGSRMFVSSIDTTADKMYEIPGFKILKVYDGKEKFAGFDKKGQVINSLNDYGVNSSFSLFTEKGTLIQKVKVDAVPGYNYYYTTYTALPNDKYAFLHVYSSIAFALNNQYFYRVVLPDGKIQDFKEYGNFSIKTLEGSDVLLFLNKFDDKNVQTIEIYNFGKYAVTTNDTEILTGVSIYPNPFEDKLTVELKNAEQGLVKVSLTNQLGQIVDSKESNETNITMNGYGSYAKGIYFLTIEQNGKKSIQKVVKN